LVKGKVTRERTAGLSSYAEATGNGMSVTLQTPFVLLCASRAIAYHPSNSIIICRDKLTFNFIRGHEFNLTTEGGWD